MGPISIARYGDSGEVAVPFSDCSNNCRPLGANRQAVGAVLDVSTRDDFTAVDEQRGAYAEVRVRRVRPFLSGASAIEEVFDINVSRSLARTIRYRYLNQAAPPYDRPHRVWHVVRSSRANRRDWQERSHWNGQGLSAAPGNHSYSGKVLEFVRPSSQHLFESQGDINDLRDAKEPSVVQP